MKANNGLDVSTPLQTLLTVVLLSHNRPTYLRRALHFYSTLPCRVLVLDSSAQPLESDETRLPSVDYRHVPEYGYWSFQTKAAYGMTLVQTPYTVMASDDDFMVHSALTDSVAFLQAHSDYSFCHGYCLMYVTEASGVTYLRRDKKVREDYNDENAEARVLSYMEQYLPPFYAVTRTHLLRGFFEAMTDRGFEWMEVGHVFFMLSQGKARVLPMPYVVRETGIESSDHKTYVLSKLGQLDPRTVTEREAFAEFLAGLPSQITQTDPQLRKRFALEAFQAMAQGLIEHRSLTLEPIFQSVWNSPEGGPSRVFGPNQYVEMPFYNQTFFDQLSEYEFLQHAMPAGRNQLRQLEGVWVRQQALLQLHANDVPETVLNRLWQAMELNPFNRDVVRTLAERLAQHADASHDDVVMMSGWASRLASVPEYDYRDTFDAMPSGRLLKWLDARNPGADQAVVLNQRLAQAGGSPQFGLFLMNLDDDMERLQVTLDSLVEGHCKAFKVVVFTTGEPPAATVVNNTLHFVKVSKSNWVDKLNQMVRQTTCDWVLLAEVGDVFTPGGLLRAGLELQAAPQIRAASVDEIQQGESSALVEILRPGFNLDLLQSVPGLMARHWLVRREVLLDAQGYSADFSEALEFDLLLRIIEQGGMSGLAHLDEPLLICRARPLADNEQERLALIRHLGNRGYKALVSSAQPGTYQIDYCHSERPLVSIILHGDHSVSALQNCITSILQRTRYTLYEVLVSVAPEHEQALNLWLSQQNHALTKVRVYANRDGLAQNAWLNTVATQARGDYLVLLAGDSQIVSPNWVGSLLNQAARPEVGAVGGKLIDEEGKVTQAGLILGFEGGVASPFVGLDKNEDGYMSRARLEQNLSAVSATCMMVRKALYDAVGGLDEGPFAQAFADVDLSLKIGQTGHLIVWAPQVHILHPGALSDDALALSALREKWADAFAQDPAYNSNLALTGKAYSLGQASGGHWQEFLA
jgi:glycosyltransferase domain-containing protein